jgi:hypothetical protein
VPIPRPEIENPDETVKRLAAARQAEAARMQAVAAAYVDGSGQADPEQVAATVQAAAGWWRSDTGVVRVDAVVQLVVRPVEGDDPGVVLWAGLANGAMVRLLVGPFASAAFAERVMAALIASGS